MKRTTAFILCLVAGVLATLTSCKSKYELLLQSNDVPAKYENAFELYNSGKYKKAAAMFESLSMLTQGLPQDDTVRYYWAMSNYKYQDFTTAEANFNSFIEFYPRSPFSMEARFLKLDCMYRSTYRYELDQTPTRLALVAISEYLVEYPNTDRRPACEAMSAELTQRLDNKEFENARLYYKMEDYIAAKTAFKNILKDNSTNSHREEILFYTAKSSYKYAQLSVPAKQKERYMEFLDEYYNFVSELPQSSFRSELDVLYNRAQMALGNHDQVIDKKTLRQEEQREKLREKSMDQKALVNETVLDQQKKEARQAKKAAKKASKETTK